MGVGLADGHTAFCPSYPPTRDDATNKTGHYRTNGRAEGINPAIIVAGMECGPWAVRLEILSATSRRGLQGSNR